MNIELFDFERKIFEGEKNKMIELSDNDINNKYELGEARIVTENGAIKLPLVNGVFASDSYEMMPVYQRRITWDNKKRSRLIESFIINIPVPPVFIYEIEYGKYEVMDGLQRISAIRDFYSDKYALEGLTEWPELNGKKYSELPKKVKEGIDRRQISVVSLLKESAKTPIQEQKMKRMVFERLNTGGVKLEEQEIRNALYDGKFNTMCKKLSENSEFRALWGIPTEINTKELYELDVVDTLDITDELASNNLYMRMYDIELVLRFFAMRHIEEFTINLSEFLDQCLIAGNSLLDEDPERKEKFEELFINTITKAKKLFGEKAFCQFKETRGLWKWSKPQRMIYDAVMLALISYEIDVIPEYNSDIQCYMEKIYKNNIDKFNGKKQSKSDILERAKLFDEIIKNIIDGNIYE